MSDKPSDNTKRWATFYEAVTGATSSTSHHHEEAPGTNAESVKAGHEPDRSNVQSQQAADAGDKHFNERIATIDSTDPHAKSAEPRLEYMKKLDVSRNGKVDDPVFVRSFQPADTGNSPIITPRDLYPDRFHDPVTGKKLLEDYEYMNKEKGIARIPVAEAMKLLKLPSKKGEPASSIAKTPKQSNGGQAIGDGPAKAEK